MIGGIDNRRRRSRRVGKPTGRDWRGRSVRDVALTKFRERCGVRVGARVVGHALSTSKGTSDIVKLGPKREDDDLGGEQNLLDHLVVNITVVPPRQQVETDKLSECCNAKLTLPEAARKKLVAQKDTRDSVRIALGYQLHIVGHRLEVDQAPKGYGRPLELAKGMAFVPRTIALHHLGVLRKAIGLHGIGPKGPRETRLQQQGLSPVHGAAHKPLGTPIGLRLALCGKVMDHLLLDHGRDQLRGVVGPCRVHLLGARPATQRVRSVGSGLTYQREALEVASGPIAENNGGLMASDPHGGLTVRHNVVSGDLVAELHRDRLTRPVPMVLAPVRGTLALGPATRGAVHVLGVVREEVPEANSLGLAGPHIVLILKHRWGGNLHRPLNVGIGRRRLASRPRHIHLSRRRVSDQRVRLIVSAILDLRLFRAKGGIRAGPRRQRGKVFDIIGGKRRGQGPSGTRCCEGRLRRLSLLLKVLCTGSLVDQGVQRGRGQRHNLTRVRRNNVRRCYNHGHSSGAVRTRLRSERARTEVGDTAMDLTVDGAPIEQSEVGRATRRPRESSLHVHTQHTNAQDPGGLWQNGGKLLGEPDLSETELDALTSIYLAIGGVESQSARVGDDNGLAPKDIALWHEMVAAPGVRDPEDSFGSAHHSHATKVLDDILQGQRPHKCHHAGDLMCSALGRGGQVHTEVRIVNDRGRQQLQAHRAGMLGIAERRQSLIGECVRDAHPVGPGAVLEHHVL